jgi:hypothetical protein
VLVVGFAVEVFMVVRVGIVFEIVVFFVVVGQLVVAVGVALRVALVVQLVAHTVRRELDFCAGLPNGSIPRRSPMRSLFDGVYPIAAICERMGVKSAGGLATVVVGATVVIVVTVVVIVVLLTAKP